VRHSQGIILQFIGTMSPPLLCSVCIGLYSVFSRLLAHARLSVRLDFRDSQMYFRICFHTSAIYTFATTGSNDSCTNCNIPCSYPLVKFMYNFQMNPRLREDCKRQVVHMHILHQFWTQGLCSDWSLRFKLQWFKLLALFLVEISGAMCFVGWV
jgi:hypothetical protein